MKTITSRDNPTYKELKQLAGSSQARRRAGRTLLDGVHLCQAWLDLRGLPMQALVSESSLANPEVAALVQRCEDARAHVTALHRERLREHGPCPVHRRSFAPVRELLFSTTAPAPQTGDLFA